MSIPYAFLNPSSRWHFPLRFLILTILGLVIYYQTFGYGFVFDDMMFIVHNPYIKRLDHIHYIWNVLPKTRLVGMYSFALNYSINQLHPAGYHIFNFLIHLLTTGLVWACARLLFKITGLLPSKNRLTQELPFLIAILFLVHPCQTQAVSYISQRFESMATLFYLGSFYCYMRARITSVVINKVVLFFCCGSLALIGIMTKEVCVTIPLMLLTAEWILWPDGFFASGKNFLKKSNLWITSFVIAVGTLLFILLFMKLCRTNFSIFFNAFLAPSESHDGDMITSGNYLLTQLRVFLTFLRLLVIPINQNVDYDYPLSSGLLSPPLTLVGAYFIAVFIFSIIKLRKQFPLVSFGLAWMLITFSANLAPRVNVIFEHKLYLISFGFFLTIISLLFSQLRQQKLLLGFFIFIIIILSATSFQRNHVWRNQLTLWEDVILKSPHKPRTFINLAVAYDKNNRPMESIYFLSKAIGINKNDYGSYMTRGTIYYKLGQQTQALKDFNQALAINPNYFLTYLRRALLYKKQNKFKEALADLTKSINLQPDFQYSYTNRGLLWMELGRTDRALKDFQHALKIAPHDFEALVDRGGLYYSLGQYELAIKDLTHAQEVDPTNVMVYKNKANCFLKINKINEALKDLQTVLHLNPTDIEARTMYQNATLLKQ